MYKNDGNAIGVPTYIWLHELTADGTATVGQPAPLIHNTLVRALAHSSHEPYHGHQHSRSDIPLSAGGLPRGLQLCPSMIHRRAVREARTSSQRTKNVSVHMPTNLS